MIYFDTSYLVRLYFDEPDSAAVRTLAATDHIACAVHGQAEMIAAFHRKLREGAIPLRAFKAVLSQLAADTEAGAFHWLPEGQEVLARVAAVFAKLPATVFLRGADALHLATAAEHGLATVYSNDMHLLDAAEYFGIEGRNVIGTTR